MQVLVTGASGFLGNALLRSLERDSSLSIIALYGTGSGFPNRGNITWHKTDLSTDNWTASLPPCEVVIHCAQAKNYRNFPDTALPVFRTNTAAMLSLLEWARRNGTKRFIFTSTGSVYGTREHGICSEDDLTWPDSFYAVSKMGAETLMHAYTNFFHCQILRIFTLYGPGQTDRLIPSLIENVLTEKPVTVASGRGISITPVFVEDVVHAITACMKQQLMTGLDITNLAGDEHFSIHDLASAIGTAYGRTAHFNTIEGDARFLLGNNKKMKARFPELRVTPLAEGLNHIRQLSP